MRRTRLPVLAGGAALSAALVLGSAGCTSSAEEPPGLTASPSATPSGSATAEAEADGDAEAAVRDVFDRFWAANVEAERGNPDPALYAGVAAGPAVEIELAIARQYQESGIAKDGEPVLTDVAVEVDGDQARAAACVDHTGWVPAGAPAPEPAVVPTEVVLLRADGVWLVNDYVEPTLELPC